MHKFGVITTENRVHLRTTMFTQMFTSFVYTFMTLNDNCIPNVQTIILFHIYDD